METVEQLTATFKAEGYTNPQLHAECKHQANVYFDVSIKNKRRFISPVMQHFIQLSASEARLHKAKKRFIKKGGKVHYLQPKGIRKSYIKVAIPASTQAGIRPAHKLTPEQAFNLDAEKIFGKY